MTMLKEVLAELASMFVGDTRLSLGIFAVIAVTAALIGVPGLDPLVGGTALVLGCLWLLVQSVRRAAPRG